MGHCPSKRVRLGSDVWSHVLTYLDSQSHISAARICRLLKFVSGLPQSKVELNGPSCNYARISDRYRVKTMVNHQEFNEYHDLPRTADESFDYFSAHLYSENSDLPQSVLNVCSHTPVYTQLTKLQEFGAVTEGCYDPSKFPTLHTLHLVCPMHNGIHRHYRDDGILFYALEELVVHNASDTTLLYNLLRLSPRLKRLVIRSKTRMAWCTLTPAVEHLVFPFPYIQTLEWLRALVHLQTLTVEIDEYTLEDIDSLYISPVDEEYTYVCEYGACPMTPFQRLIAYVAAHPSVSVYLMCVDDKELLLNMYRVVQVHSTIFTLQKVHGVWPQFT